MPAATDFTSGRDTRGGALCMWLGLRASASTTAIAASAAAIRWTTAAVVGRYSPERRLIVPPANSAWCRRQLLTGVAAPRLLRASDYIVKTTKARVAAVEARAPRVEGLSNRRMSTSNATPERKRRVGVGQMTAVTDLQRNFEACEALEGSICQAVRPPLAT